MKKIFAFVLAAVLLFSFCSCKKSIDPKDITDIEITFYENYEEYEQREGKTVFIGNDKNFAVASVAKRMTESGKSTSKPMDMPRYDICFKSGGKEHFIYADYDNIFAASFLKGGNYFCLEKNDYYSEIEKLFNKAE